MSGEGRLEMVRECKNGVMDRVMMENGLKEEHSDKENSLTLMEMFTKEVGNMTRPTDTVSTITSMEDLTKASGKMIFNMATEKKNFPITLYTQVSTQQVKSMVTVFYTGPKAQSTMENGLKIRSKEWALTLGKMEDCIEVAGKTTKWMAMECKPGLMAKLT